MQEYLLHIFIFIFAKFNIIIIKLPFQFIPHIIIFNK